MPAQVVRQHAHRQLQLDRHIRGVLHGQVVADAAVALQRAGHLIEQRWGGRLNADRIDRQIDLVPAAGPAQRRRRVLQLARELALRQGGIISGRDGALQHLAKRRRRKQPGLGDRLGVGPAARGQRVAHRQAAADALVAQDQVHDRLRADIAARTIAHAIRCVEGRIGLGLLATGVVAEA